MSGVGPVAGGGSPYKSAHKTEATGKTAGHTFTQLKPIEKEAFKAPTDYSSPTILKRVQTKFTSKATQIKSDTKNVGKYFSGKTNFFPDFISSLRKTV